MCNKRKALLLVVIAVLLMATITGCGKKEQAEPAATTETTETTTEATMDTTFVENMSEEEVEELFQEQEETTEATSAENISEEANNEANSETKPQKETEPATKETEPAQTVPQSEQAQTEYERYMAMSGDEQYAFFQSFASPEAFMDWMNAAQAEYEEKYPSKELDGTIDLDEVFKSLE